MLEILAPAGNADCAKAAIHNGANAIYVGFSSFSARQSADNFDEAGLRTLLLNAHLHGVKVYVAMNTIVKDVELESFIKTLLVVWEWGADAIILQDVFLGKYIHRLYPEIVLHLSTQAGVCNVYGAKLAKEYGFSRVILARETSLADIKEIAQIIEMEVFVQGALCTCFSGQCYFSSFVGGNSGNRGRCKQPCRKLYAYDRNGNEEKSYALSLSDLSVGKEIDKLIQAGVVSFKIEGRMRRAEYVAAAVRYYRKVLDNTAGLEESLSDLKRTYNRGNYTVGLTFGQDKRFISPNIQGHLGEKVGIVKVLNGKFFVESVFVPQKGDAFKILRAGKEVGGASFERIEKRGFILSSKARLKNGDNVFITTDTKVNEKVLQTKKATDIFISLYFKEGEPARAWCSQYDVCLTSEEKLQSAKNQALTKDTLKNCFQKTDGIEVNVVFEECVLEGDIFIPKSKLNAFRREFFARLFEKISKNRHTRYAVNNDVLKINYKPINVQNKKIAVISSDFTGMTTDIAILKGDTLFDCLPKSFLEGNFEKYLYYPAFLNGKDCDNLKSLIDSTKIDGLYVENYGGIAFAKENNLKIFAGNGLNLLNKLSVSIIQEEDVCYYALSKEGNYTELKSLISEKAFVLSSGDIKIMDLLYCPFGKACKDCDKKWLYALRDENDRTFVVRRYEGTEKDCRFEVFNCARLVGKGVENAGNLIDVTTITQKEEAVSLVYDEEGQKALYQTYTSGHFKRGIL